ncbi:MAG: hypothetical protein ACREAB_21000, partial [Blastocatellia bacterium]
GGLFLLGIIVVGGLVYWVSQNKDKWIQSAEQLGKEAKEFGAKTDNEGCLNEALARHKRDKSITGRISTQIFLSVCLQQSEPSPGFCDGVPPKGEMMKSINWTLKKCADAELQNDQDCRTMFSAVQEYCHRSKQQQEN